MPIRSISSALTASLKNNDPFNYAHLIKFERPTLNTGDGIGSLKSNTFSYITDGAIDIDFDDGSVDAEGNANGSQLYIANKVTKIGTTTETTQAKVTSMNLTIDLSAIDASISTHYITYNSTANVITVGQTEGDQRYNLIDAGFREGDKITFNSAAGEFNNGKSVIIKNFLSVNKFSYTNIDLETSGTIVSTGVPLTINVTSEEMTGLTRSKEATDYTTYINRDVFIYKAHLDVDTGAIIGEPYLLFKGIIASANIKEVPDKASSLIWSLTSHWGDFSRVNGRLTLDEYHRALDAQGVPDRNIAVRPIYASDRGFEHATQSLNVIARYNAKEIRYKQVDINGWWFGGKRQREYYIDVEREANLSFNLAAKYLPVVYGVRKIDAIPVFVDTDRETSSTVFIAYALCEGQIAGLLDIHVEGNNLICSDSIDQGSRGSENSTTQVVCKGRMDRGEALTGYNANSTGASSTVSVPVIKDYLSIYGIHSGNLRDPDNLAIANVVLQAFNIQPIADEAANSKTGLIHENTHSFDSPIRADLQFHAGLPNQEANNTLMAEAVQQNFKVQNDYYISDNITDYWGANHRLLDTAYVVAKYQIKDGETSIPELDFVVRGKGIETHNYDRSYTVSTRSTNADVSSINLGDAIVLKKTTNNDVIHTGTVIDKWTFIDVDGNTETRFRFDYEVDITIPFYVSLVSNTNTKIHFSPDVGGEGTGTVGPRIEGDVSSIAINSSTGLLDLTVSGLEDLLDSEIASFHSKKLVANGGNVGTTVSGDQNDILLAEGGDDANGVAVHQNITDAGLNTQTVVGFGGQVDSTVATGDMSISVLLPGDLIRLGTVGDNTDGVSTTDGFYAGSEITVTRIVNGVANRQVRKIRGYSGSKKIAVVDDNWDLTNYIPDNGGFARFSALITDSVASSIASNTSSSTPLVLNDGTNTIRITSFSSVTTVAHLVSQLTSAIDVGTFLYSAEKVDIGSSTFLRFKATTVGPKPFTPTLIRETSGGDSHIQFSSDSNAILGAGTDTDVETPPLSRRTIPGRSADTWKITHGKKDVRVSLNPAMQLLDYLTNNRYGRSLDLEKDIRLETFKEAARQCDTRSTVKVIIKFDSTSGNETNNLAIGQKYEYKVGSAVHFRGTVSEFKNVTHESTPSVTDIEITFTDVLGKFGKKYNNYTLYRPGELIWQNGRAYKRDSSASGNSLVAGLPAHGQTANGVEHLNSTGTVILTEVDSSQAGPARIIVVHKSNETAEHTRAPFSAGDGNPFVKAFKPLGNGVGTYIRSGYGLYDSDGVKFWRYLGWDSPDQRNVTRHQMSHVVDTSQSIFENINLMLKQFNGVLRYANGKYELAIKTQSPSTFDEVEIIEESDIIGSISIKDSGLKKSYNSITSSVVDPQAKFEGRSVSFFNSDYLKEDKMVKKQGNYGQPGITNYFNARYNIAQYLDESRYGLRISFKTMPKGVLLQAGNIIRINYPRFGYENKEFRIDSLSFDSDCLVTVTADEHNNDAYAVRAIERPVLGNVQGEDGGSFPAFKAPQGATGLTVVNTKSDTSITNDGSFELNKAYTIVTPGTTNWNTIAGEAGAGVTYTAGSTLIATVTSGGGNGTARGLTREVGKAFLSWTPGTEALTSENIKTQVWAQDADATTIPTSGTAQADLLAATTNDDLDLNLLDVLDGSTKTYKDDFSRQGDGAGRKYWVRHVLEASLNSTTGSENTIQAVPSDFFPNTRTGITSSTLSTLIRVSAPANTYNDNTGQSTQIDTAVLGTDGNPTLDTRTTTTTTTETGTHGTVGNLTVGGNLILNQSGKLHTSGKTSFGDTDAGIFIGYDTASTSAYKLNIGNSTDSVQWDGSDLAVTGTINANAGVFTSSVSIGATGSTEGSLVISNKGKIHTTEKTSFADTDAGIFLGYDTDAYKVNIGNATKNLKWDGTNLTVSGNAIIGSTAASSIETSANDPATKINAGTTVISSDNITAIPAFFRITTIDDIVSATTAGTNTDSVTEGTVLSDITTLIKSSATMTNIYKRNALAGDIVVVEKTSAKGTNGSDGSTPTTNEKGTMRSFVCTTGGDSSQAVYSEKENTFDATLITPSSIGSNKLTANSITARELDVNAITADHIGAGVITAEHIGAGSITANQISSTTKIEVFTPSNPSAEVLTPVSGTYAALDGAHDTVRIHAGGTGASPATAPFRVLGTGKVVATNISLQTTDGTEFFNSSEGFVDGAFAQIAAQTGTRVSTFGETFTGDIGNSETNNTDTYEKITIDQTLTLQQTLKFDVSQFGKTADVEFHGDPANPLILNITNGATPALSDIKKADGTTQIGRAPKNGEFIRLNFTNVQAAFEDSTTGSSGGLLWSPEGFLNADGTALVSSFTQFSSLVLIAIPLGNSSIVYKINHTGNNRLYFNFVSGGSSLSRLNTPTQALTDPTINDPLNGVELELLTRPTFGGSDTKIIDTGDNSIGGNNSFSFSQVTSAPTSGIDANTVYILASFSQVINSSGIPVKRLTKEPILGFGAVSSEGFVSKSVTTTYNGTAGTPVIKYYHSKCFTTFTGESAVDRSTTSRQFNVTSTTSGIGFLLASSGQATTSVQDIDLTNITGDIGNSGNITVGGNATVSGNLTVSGTTTTLNTATLNVEDKNITLNYATGDTSSTANGAGITIQDAVDASTDATILWDATNDEFDFSHKLNIPALISNNAAEGNTYFTGGTANARLLNVFTSTHDSAANAGHNFKIASGQGAFIFGNNTTANLLTVKTGGIDVTGTADVSSQVLVGNNNSIFAENNLAFKSSGGAFIDHFTASQSFTFRTTTSSALDTNALVLTSAGAATFAGAVTANAGVVVDNITIDGNEIDVGSGDLTLDVAGDIILDADGEDIRFKDDGVQTFVFTMGTGSTISTPRGSLTLDVAGDIILDADGGDIYFKDDGVTNFQIKLAPSSAGVELYTNVADDDLRIILNDSDGGGNFTALEFDASEAGAATFSSTVTASGDITTSAKLKASEIRVMEGNSLAGGLFKEKSLTGSGSSNDLSIFAEGISNGGDIHFFTGGSATKKLTIASSGAATFTGAVTANAGVVVDNITIDGNEIDVSSGNLTIDVLGNINLQAGDDTLSENGSGNINFTAMATDTSGGFFNFNYGSTAILRIAGQDKPGIDFKSNTHAKLFPHTDNKITFGNQSDGTDCFVFTTGGSPELDVTGNFILDVSGDIGLDAGGNDITLLAAATEFAHLSHSSGDFLIQTAQTDKDIIFKGIDSSADPTVITALTIDMSNAGYATFNSTVKGTDGVFTGNGNVGLDVGMGTDKRIIYQGNIGEIGSVAGFQAVNTAGNANTAFGIRATDIRFATGSAERVRITDTGVGIGTTTPDHILEIETVSSTADLNIGFRNTQAGAQIGMPADTNALRFITGDTERLRITSAGNVGIGTTAPSFKFHVSGTNTQVAIESTTTNLNSSLYYIANGANQWEAGVNITAGLDYEIYDRVNNASRFVVGHNGNVGIGTTSPDANSFGAGHGILAVASATGSAKTAMLNLMGDGNDTDATRVASLFFNDQSATGAGATLAGVEAYRASDHATDPGADLLFSTNASGGSYTEKMRIDSSGNVGIGVTSIPSWANLITNGTVAVGGKLYVKQDQSIQGLTGFPGAAGNLILNDAGGNVGIGTTSPNSYVDETVLTINGTSFARLDLESGGTLRSSLFGGAAYSAFVAGTSRLQIENSGYIKLDSATDITLDAGGGDVLFKDDGTLVGTIGNFSTGNFEIKSEVSDKDIIFKGVDSSANPTEVTALTLDMSEAGAATFNSTVTANAGVVVDNITIDGTEIDLSSGDLTLDVAGNIVLDADGGGVYFKDDGTTIGFLQNSSNDFRLVAGQSDKDIVFIGTDSDGSPSTTITALTLDMSEAGAATFNNNVTAFSDRRLKDNIETLDSQKTYQMRGVSYTRDGRPGSGVIAQELEEVAPELVLTNDEGIKSVDYGRTIGYLIETIKDLKREVEELKDDVASLRK